MPDSLHQLQAAIDANGPRTEILVVGDLMLDRYLTGRADRISPEAPVPVVDLHGERVTPGGAGNVAANLVGLGVGVRVAGVVGRDGDGDRLLAQLRDRGIDCEAVLPVVDRPTTTKTRVLARDRQVLRLDRECRDPLPDADQAALLQRCRQALDSTPAAMVLSDYAKGVLGSPLCGDLIQHARERGIPVLVDPKGSGYERYRGARALTPNRHELARVADVAPHDLPALLAAGRKLREGLGLDFLLLTLGSEGMRLIEADGDRAFAAQAREVFDVSGAGDTVIATLAASMALGLPLGTAVELANRAAGLTVERMGVHPIHRDALRQDPATERGTPILATHAAAAALARGWRDRGERVVFTNGCFDLLHAGHVALLDQARRQGDRLVVGLNTDRSVRALKGPRRPVQAEGARATVLAALRAVDAVVLFDEDTPATLIEALRPDVLVKGADYQEHEIVGAATVRAYGGRVLRVPLEPDQSTSALLSRAQEDERS